MLGVLAIWWLLWLGYFAVFAAAIMLNPSSRDLPEGASVGLVGLAFLSATATTALILLV